MSLKTRVSENVPYSKGSWSRLIFFDQLIKYSIFLVSLWIMINTEERTLTVSPCVGVVELRPQKILFPEMPATRKIFTRAAANLFFLTIFCSYSFFFFGFFCFFWFLFCCCFFVVSFLVQKCIFTLFDK